MSRRRRGGAVARRDRCTPCSAAPTSAPGFWDLVAGGAARGARPRALIDRAITPVWEANHVWLIFVLVVLWTGFPEAFAAIFSTLFVPLALAALGIVLRGAGFALRHVAGRLGGASGRSAPRSRSRRVMTPFFLGTVVGAIASGRVPGGRLRRPADELVQRDVDRDRARCSWPPAPTWPRRSSSPTPAAAATPSSRTTSGGGRSARGRRRGCAGGRRHRRPARRRALRLRRPHERRAAARDRLGAVRRAALVRARARERDPGAAVRRRRRRRRSCGDGASPSTPTCCRPR